MSQKQNCLIVDDDGGMRDTLTAILSVNIAFSGSLAAKLALPILNREDVDLMPLTSGCRDQRLRVRHRQETTA
jgi:hypothetical protein